MNRLALIGENHGRPFRMAKVNGTHDLRQALEKAFRNNRHAVQVNPADFVMENLTLQYGGTGTSTGGINVTSRVKARSAKETKEVKAGDMPNEVISMIFNKISESNWLAVPRTMCQADGFESNCMVIVPAEYARIAYMWGKTLFPPKEGAVPDSVVLFLPGFPGNKQSLSFRSAA